MSVDSTEHARERGGQWRPVFIAALRNSANVRAACQASKVDRGTAYKARVRSAEFRAQWDEAIEDACDLLEAAAFRDALKGSVADRQFLLKAHRPEKYGEKVQLEILIRQAAEKAAAEAGMDPKDIIAEAERLIASH